MPVPVAYTEDQLKSYLHGRLGGVATVLGWAVAEGDYDEIVNDVLIAYGESDIANATNIEKLRALARWKLWQAAVEGLAHLHDYRLASGDEETLSQIKSHAESMLTIAESEAGRYSRTHAVRIIPISRTQDPYNRPVSDEFA